MTSIWVELRQVFVGNWRKGIAAEPVVLERAGEVADGNEQEYEEEEE